MKLTQWQKGLAFALLAPLLYTVKSVGIKFAPPAKVEFFLFFRFVFDFLLLTPFFSYKGTSCALSDCRSI